MALDTETLCRHIHESFGQMPYPGDEQIVTGENSEDQKILRLLKGLHWQDVPWETLDQLRTDLSFMSPEGFRFYLPTFMIYCIVDFDRADVAVDRVIANLTLLFASELWSKPSQAEEDERWWQNWFFERVSGFNALQAKVIREFLEYMRDVNGERYLGQEPQTALDRYWHQF
jgi:Family of unknown function (DUF6714)